MFSHIAAKRIGLSNFLPVSPEKAHWPRLSATLNTAMIGSIGR